MKCSAWEKWDLIDDEMIPTLTCPRDAVYLVSNRPHWENQPFCSSCTFWITNGYHADKYAKGIEVEVIAK